MKKSNFTALLTAAFSFVALEAAQATDTNQDPAQIPADPDTEITAPAGNSCGSNMTGTQPSATVPSGSSAGVVTIPVDPATSGTADVPAPGADVDAASAGTPTSTQGQ